MTVDFSDLLVLLLAFLNVVQSIVFAAFSFAGARRENAREQKRRDLDHTEP